MLVKDRRTDINTFILFPCGKFRSPYLGKATAAARAALPIPTTVLSIFLSNQWYGLQCMGLITFAQMLMHATAHIIVIITDFVWKVRLITDGKCMKTIALPLIAPRDHSSSHAFTA